MGAEAKCRLQLGRFGFGGHVRLAPEELIFNGDTHLAIAFADVRSVELGREGELMLTHTAGEFVLKFEQTAVAARWAKALKRATHQLPNPQTSSRFAD